MAFLLKLTFQRQLGVAVALGILLLALFSSMAGAWLVDSRARSNLIEQGRHITESLARQSTLALVYASAENAAEAANTTLNFPGVVSVGVRDANGHLLLQRGAIAAEFPERLGGLSQASGVAQVAVLDAESADAWHFTAPVYSQPASSPFNEAPAPELLGEVEVVLSKAALAQMTTGIFTANLAMSFSFALLLLLLIRFLANRMTQPLKQLSACMGRAEAGELKVRAELAGPRDIADMAHAFNCMMTELEEHAAEIRQLNAELEQRVARRTAQLEAANRELEDFSYSMSHDMRTPLRALDGFSRILLEEHGSRLDDEGRRLLRVLRDNALRMGRLVDDILHFLRMGRMKMEEERLDVALLVAEVAEELKAETRGRSLRFEIGALPQAWGDRGMIREVVQNLMSNAVKFSPGDGEALIEIGCEPNGDENVYWVRDHGVGFDMRYVDKLFRVFERVHATGQYEGSGIGLALVKRVVTRHGGRVWAEGREGEGATIYFALPARQRATLADGVS